MAFNEKCLAGQSGFSLVEVVLALGIAAFALLSIVALLPVGITDNKVSAEETRALDILTLLNSDLRNTDPRANNSTGTSTVYGLQLPYAFNTTSQKVTFNALTPITSGSVNVPSGWTTGVDRSEARTSLTPPSAYQATVVYLSTASLTTAGSLAPLEARLIVNWPGLKGPSSISDLTNRSKVAGYVEAYVTFPAP